jgi:hypothetical protein
MNYPGTNAQTTSGTLTTPEVPTNPSVSLDPAGRARLAWQSGGPAEERRPGDGHAVSFIVYRQDPGSAGPRVIGLTNALHYTDEDAPLVPGAPVLYLLQALRAGKSSPMTMPICIHLPIRATTTAAVLPAFNQTQGKRAA